MKIEYIYGEDSDGYAFDSIEIKMDSGKTYSESAGAMWDCPEDATLERDLISCDRILNLMKVAYEAGKRGEDLFIERVESEEY